MTQAKAVDRYEPSDVRFQGEPFMVDACVMPGSTTPGETSAILSTVIFLVFLLGFVIFLIRVARRRRAERRHLAAAGLSPQQVQRQTARPQPMRGQDRLRFNAVIFVGYGIWAAVLTAHGAPIAGPLARFVFLEVALATFRVASITGSDVNDERVVARVSPILVALCQRAGCSVARHGVER